MPDQGPIFCYQDAAMAVARKIHELLIRISEV
jgi:hypothetical protein